MVKTEAYTFPKPWPDKPECAGSSPVRGIELATINPLVVGLGSDGMLTRYKSCQLIQGRFNLSMPFSPFCA